MSQADPFQLSRFHSAQETSFAAALAELKRGRKTSHWMWFIFPQMRGLGRSPMADRYGITSINEARAYLADNVLSQRLSLCTSAALGTLGNTAHDIFGSPDDLKFHSSMSLFDRADGKPNNIYRQALVRFFSGVPDLATVERLSRQ